MFFKAGFSGLISRYGFKRHVHPLKRHKGKEEEQELVLALNFRLALESLGPVFVKFGQILSTRSDFLPKTFINQLEKLQAKVPPFKYEKAVETIENEFQKPLKKLFKEFGEKPFASASLGQVYKAKLHTGEVVAVKVQRPKAKEQILLDTEVLLAIAHIAEKYSSDAKKFNLLETVQEFRRWTLNELDYRKEATNCEIFTNFFKKDKNIYGPKVFWDYTSESVLCLEFVEGKQVSEVIKDLDYPQEEKAQLARHVADAFIRQFFEYGFFHADPHPGNVFVLPDNKILFLDFGMVGFLDESLTALGSAMFLALIQKDTQNLVDLFIKMEENYDERLKEQKVEDLVNINNLRKELNVLILQWSSGMSGQGNNFTKLFSEMLNIAVQNGISVPTDLTMMGKAIVTLDVVAKQLSSDFKIEEWEKSTLQRIVKRKLSAKNLQSRAQNMGLIIEDLIKRLPASSSSIVSNIEKGRFGMEINTQQLVDYERLLNANSKISSYGTLLGAIILASALIYQVTNQPKFFGFTIAQIGLYGSVILIALFFLGNLKKGND